MIYTFHLEIIIGLMTINLVLSSVFAFLGLKTLKRYTKHGFLNNGPKINSKEIDALKKEAAEINTEIKKVLSELDRIRS